MAQTDVLAGREMYRRRTAAEYVAEASRWATALNRLDSGNRDPRRAVRTRVRLLDARATGVMIVHEVTGDGLDAVNTFARPHAVSVRNTKRDVGGEHVDISFPPNSFTVLEIQLD